MHAVGLFKPLSYQDRAVQLSHDNQTMVCYEPLDTASDTSTVSWQDSELLFTTNNLTECLYHV